jgi:hypothetical protein
VNTSPASSTAPRNGAATAEEEKRQQGRRRLSPRRRPLGSQGLCRHTDGRRKRVSIYGDTEREALNELNKLRDHQRRGIPVATTTLTVVPYMTYWLSAELFRLIS